MKKFTALLLVFVIAFAVISIPSLFVEEVSAASLVTSLVSGRTYVIRVYTGQSNLTGYTASGHYWHSIGITGHSRYVAKLSRNVVPTGDWRKFKLVKTGNYWYIYQVTDTGNSTARRTGIKNGSTANGESPASYAPNTNQSQKFLITNLGGTKFSIKTGSKNYTQTLVAQYIDSYTYKIAQVVVSDANKYVNTNCWEFIQV